MAKSLTRFIYGIAYNILAHENDNTAPYGTEKVVTIKASIIPNDNDTNKVEIHDNKYIKHPKVILNTSRDNLNLTGTPLCLQHDRDRVVGKIASSWVDGNNLKIKGEIFDPDMISALDQKLYNSLSISYSTDMTTGAKKFREVSICKDPVLPGCEIIICASKDRISHNIHNDKKSFLYKRATHNSGDIQLAMAQQKDGQETPTSNLSELFNQVSNPGENGSMVVDSTKLRKLAEAFAEQNEKLSQQGEELKAYKEQYFKQREHKYETNWNSRREAFKELGYELKDEDLALIKPYYTEKKDDDVLQFLEKLSGSLSKMYEIKQQGAKSQKLDHGESDEDYHDDGRRGSAQSNNHNNNSKARLGDAGDVYTNNGNRNQDQRGHNKRPNEASSNRQLSSDQMKRPDGGRNRVQFDTRDPKEVSIEASHDRPNKRQRTNEPQSGSFNVDDFIKQCAQSPQIAFGASSMEAGLLKYLNAKNTNQ